MFSGGHRPSLAIWRAESDANVHDDWFLYIMSELAWPLIEHWKNIRAKMMELLYPSEIMWPPYSLPFEVFLDNNPYLIGCCPGLAIVLAGARGFDAIARQRLDYLEGLSQSMYVRPLQLALGCMAVGEHDKAIAALAQACDEHDPFLVWLHLWPVLKPLREHQGFKDLVERMDPPANMGAGLGV